MQQRDFFTPQSRQGAGSGWVRRIRVRENKMLFPMKLIRLELVLVIATLLSTTYTASPLIAIKERALAKHKSSESHVPVAASSHTQVSKVSLSSVQKSEAQTSGKKWRTVYSKYKGSGPRLQSYQGQPSERSVNVATPDSPHSTTTIVTFPGFANLDIRKDQSLTKQTGAEQDSSPIMPHEIDNGIKKEQNVRSGYLMPDEELLQKWTNSS